MADKKLIERLTAQAYKLLAAKARSENELRHLLIEKKWEEPELMEEAVNEVLARLKELRYVDDRLLAYDFVKSKVNMRPLGKARVARDLARRKVTRKIADEALDLVFDDATEESLIDKAIERRIRIRGNPTNREEAKKLFDHLVRLGFPFDLVSKKVRALKGKVMDEMSDEL